MLRSKSVMARSISLAAMMGLVCAHAACSVLVKTDPTQCQTDGDCAAEGAAFADTVCEPTKHVCIARKRCQSNKECIDAAGGAPAICRASDQRCQPVLSEDCAEIAAPDRAGQRDRRRLDLAADRHPRRGRRSGAALGGPRAQGG